MQSVKGKWIWKVMLVICIFIMESSLISFVEGKNTTERSSKEQILLSDDFNEKVLDQTKWAIHPIGIEKGRGIKIQNGVLYAGVTEQGKHMIIKTVKSNFSNFVLEVKCKRVKTIPELPDNQLGIFFRGVYLYIRENSVWWLHQGTRKLHSKRKEFKLGEWHIIKIVAKNEEADVFIDGEIFFHIQSLHKKESDIAIRSYQMVIALDYVKISSLESKMVELLPPNIAPNSSFEQCTNPDLPDCWGYGFTWGLHSSIWIKSEENYQEWHRKWFLDKHQSYDGKYSMRITYPLQLQSIRIRVEQGKTYTLSAYIKSDRENLPVLLTVTGYGAGVAHKKVKVGKNWQRYSFTTKIQSGDSKYISIKPLSPGTIWVDAVQFEKSSTATPYRPTMPGIAPTTAAFKKNIAPIPEMICKKVSVPPVLDGNLDDPCWKKATKINLVLTDNNQPKEPTIGYILRDDKNLYIGMKCINSKMKKVVCKAKKHDDSVWTDGECVEIFIDPGGSRTHYFHFAVNPLGVQYESEGMSRPSWDGFWQAKTQRSDSGWSVEISIPFGILGLTPASSGTWGINICRENNIDLEYSVWSPTYGGFHTPERFGHLKGFDSSFLSRYFYTPIEFSLMPDSPEKNTLTFACKLKNDTGKSEYLLCKAIVQNESGLPSKKEISVRLKKNEIKTLLVSELVSKRDGLKKCSITLTDKKGNILAYYHKILKVSGIMESFLTRSYYTSEDKANLAVKINLAQKKLKDKMLLCELFLKGNKKLIQKREIVSPSTYQLVELPLSGLKDGDYEVVTTLVYRNSKKVVATCKDTLKKIPPSNTEVKINRLSRSILVNGKNYLPFSIFYEYVPTPEILKFFKRNGFKTVFIVVRKGYDVEKVRSVLQVAEDLDLKMMVFVASIYRHAGVEALKNVINNLKDCPAIIGWLVVDEPGIGLMKDDEPKRKKEILEALKIAKETDPYHISFVNYEKGGLYRRVCGLPGEILSVDDYCVGDKMGHLKKTLEEMSVESIPYRRPAWLFLQSGGYAYTWSREPTPSEVEYMTYFALIKGVTGLSYFSGVPRSIKLWEKLKQLNKEVLFLTPMLLSNKPVPQVETSSGHIYCTIRSYQGKFYLIAVNEVNEPISTTFNLSSLRISGRKKVKVLFENRNVILEGSKLKDTFKGYQRHVYEIEL